MWSAYHVFLVQLNGRSYRASSPMDDAAFERLMGSLQWRMPYNLRAYHCGSPRQALENPILRTFPMLPEPVEHILSEMPAQQMRLKDKRRQQTLPVLRKCGDYVIADTKDGYGRFYRVDGSTSSLITKLEAAPITLNEARSLY